MQSNLVKMKIRYSLKMEYLTFLLVNESMKFFFNRNWNWNI
jgi:hypothetical protein